MTLEEYKKLKLPDVPGIYRFMDGDTILYIGKATSLRDRVKSYFMSDVIKSRGPRIVDMVTKAKTVTYEKVASVLEALILESHLIKTIQPHYNTREKDDKSYYVVQITDERFPRVLMERARDLEYRKEHDLETYKVRSSFGPFPNGYQLREALKLLKKLFPFFDTKQPIESMSEKDKGRIMLNIQIGLYPNVFSGETSRAEYLKTIRRIERFMEGDFAGVRRELNASMNDFVKEREFEKAQKVKHTLYALDHIKDVSLIKRDDGVATKRIEAYDASHISGMGMVGVMVVLDGGMPDKARYRKFNIAKKNAGDDYGALKEMLARRMRHTEWPIPDVIVIDGGEIHRGMAVQALQEIGASGIPVVSVVKDERHRARDVLGLTAVADLNKDEVIRANEEAHRFAVASHRIRRRIVSGVPKAKKKKAI